MRGEEISIVYSYRVPVRGCHSCVRADETRRNGDHDVCPTGSSTSTPCLAHGRDRRADVECRGDVVDRRTEQAGPVGERREQEGASHALVCVAEG